MTVKFEFLEQLRNAVKDDSVHLAAGQVTETSLATDRSTFKVKVSLWPAKREIIATQTSAGTGNDSGFAELAEVGDMVIVCFLDGLEDYAFVIAKLPTVQKPIPRQAATGDTVVRARPGKKLHLGSDTRINLGLLGANTEPTQPLVLGLVFKALMTDYMTQFEALADAVEAMGAAVATIGAQVKIIGTAANTDGGFNNIGIPPGTVALSAGNAADSAGSAADAAGAAADAARAAVAALRGDPVGNNEVLSDLAFTEKGN